MSWRVRYDSIRWQPPGGGEPVEKVRLAEPLPIEADEAMRRYVDRKLAEYLREQDDEDEAS